MQYSCHAHLLSRMPNDTCWSFWVSGVPVYWPLWCHHSSLVLLLPSQLPRSPTAAAETTDQVGSMYYYPSSESQVAWNYGESQKDPEE